MFRPLRISIVALLALAALAPRSSAQEPSWNRKIADIRLVHPPGTPPGDVRVTPIFDVLITDALPTPSHLGMDVIVYLNGVPIATTPIGVDPVSQVIACFPTQNCPQTFCGNVVVTQGGTIADTGAVCYDPPGDTFGCNCWLNGFGPWFTDLVVGPGDVIGVAITAHAGSLPEIYTQDDSFSVRVGDVLPGVEFCFGDGSGTACPCGNAGSIGNGCANSLNPLGANLTATGTASVAADSVVLTASGMPNSTCLFFQGTTQLAGTAFGDGLRCAGGTVVRLGTKLNAAGASSYPTGSDPSIAVKGLIPAPGGTRTYQAWYRNAAVYCTSSTFNLTNGVSIAWNP
ncbi:MAG: hypothetical protein JNK02_15340 [Planctomycetes bacterium]|nr:hypothetical protein [Planctomycetota bacterium]